jgi:hypothetical protein
MVSSLLLNGTSARERSFQLGDVGGDVGKVGELEHLAQDGRITLPFDKTFWSPGFGMAVDRFGIPWMVNTEEAAAAASA